jgi:O-antigen/teichoic acid export membrane protein
MNAWWTRYLPDIIREWLEGRHDLQKTIGNTGWLMGGQIVRQGIGLVIGVLMARHFGPALYGEFNYALAFVALFTTVGLLGLDGIVIRELVRDPSCRDDALGTSFLMMLIGGGVSFGLAMLAIRLVRGTDPLVLWLVGIMSAGAIFQAFNAIEFWLESRLQWKFSAIAKGSVLLVGGLVKVGLILKHASLVAFAWTGLVEAVAGAAGLAITYRSQGLRLQAWRFNVQMAVQLLKDSWPMMFSAFVTMVYLRIDQVMLGNLAGSEQLGIYSAAVRLAEPWGFLSMAICSSVFPAIVKAGSSDNEAFDARLQRLYNLMALIAYCIAIPTTFFSGWLVNTLYGPAYSKAGPLLAVLVWGSLFTNLGTARTIYMITKNWTKANLLSLLSGALINIALNYCLIPSYGAMGAVTASLISYWFAVHGSCIFFRPLHKTAWMLTKAMIYPKVW